MDIQTLEIFLTVADQLHFGRASRICNMSPSALTRAVQRLEDELGTPLFVRDNRRVALTSAGERFRVYARQALQEWQECRAEIRSEPEVSGALSIYASVTAVYSLLPDLLEEFRVAYPSVRVELHTGAAEQALEQVLSGEIDLAVAALPDRHLARVEFLPLTETPLVFIAPKQSGAVAVPLRGGRPDFSAVPLVVPQSGLSRERLDQWMRRHRVTPKVTTEVSGNEAIIAMVRLGSGAGVVPQLVLERSPFRDEIRVIEDAPQLDPYTVGLCATRRSLQRPGVKALWDLAAASGNGS